jgi:hypothetical protein
MFESGENRLLTPARRKLTNANFAPGLPMAAKSTSGVAAAGEICGKFGVRWRLARNRQSRGQEGRATDATSEVKEAELRAHIESGSKSK